MYSLLIYLYIAGVKLAALFGHRKARLLVEGHKNIFPLLKERLRPGEKYLWFHVSSLGEFEQGRPVMERLRESHPEYRIVLTFFSPSGYESAKKYQSADIICYLPFDTRRNVGRFLDMLKPEKAFFIKYEFWPNFLAGLKKRGVPTYSVSSIFRKEQMFFKTIDFGYRKTLKCFTHLFVQDNASKELLSSIGLDNVTVIGDTRFDRVMKIAADAKQLALVETFAEGKRVFVAGSSWTPDEDIFIKYFNAHKGWKLIIASHEVTEARLTEIQSKFSGKCVRYTQANMDEAREADCLLIDCFGLLSSIYRYGKVAYVGGGFGAGVHNLLEAAVYGMPVFFGPNNRKFREAQKLKECGGGLEISSYEDFEAKMNIFDADENLLAQAGAAAGEYVGGNSGATQKLLAALNLL
ncbi:MAG: 3-deoxy-D-manno-octulosonic acid transferase [Bacteroidaceae bacterium]|nr:3-deoxy-D-manno-octulosonic acid transferase [Bacteroidaceae bacterium]